VIWPDPAGWPEKIVITLKGGYNKTTVLDDLKSFCFLFYLVKKRISPLNRGLVNYLFGFSECFLRLWLPKILSFALKNLPESELDNASGLKESFTFDFFS
jgi:hypothetical protein